MFFLPRVSAQAEVLPNTLPIAAEASTAQMIVQYASFYGIDGRLALHIAQCESTLVAGAHNPHSSAKGIFQFIDSSWERYARLKWGDVRDVLNAKDNIELGTWVLATYGTGDWSSSSDCWA